MTVGSTQQDAALPLGKEELLSVYRKMRTIRDFEERLHVDFGRGDIPGFVHLYAGEEAAGVGIMHHLNDGDRIASTHRGHGHCIAKGVDPVAMMKEIYGKKGGSCNGKGGSMHIADLRKGMLGANAIVGAAPPIAVGAALTAATLGNKGVALAFIGDGASNQGTVFEALNLASILKLPMIFLYENNGYAEFTGVNYHCGGGDIAGRAAGFGMPGVKVDGTDFFAVSDAMAEAVRRARAGEGPTAIEAVAMRWYGHFEGDMQAYRVKGEVDELRAKSDPIRIFVDKVVAQHGIGREELAAIDAEIEQLIDLKVDAAKAAPVPPREALYSDVYVSYA
jgi:pyruvate dehydrogenase E1 component alpha subunit